MISTGDKIGRYEIRSQIGKGGMGEVFLAEDTELERLVALKVLPEVLATDVERMRRFVQEAKSASALNHPNIITIHEIGKTADAHFIAAEYIEGETLHSLLRGEPMNLKFVLEIAIQMASALDAAHRAAIVHRDIKPENIMIRPDGLVKILDFGIAKLIENRNEPVEAEAATAIRPETTKDGLIIGTAAYMSPEQARGKPVDARTDIFSFGVVLYEMLAGKPPFDGESAIETISSIIHKEPVPVSQLAPDIPRELKHIVEKSLRKDREERYQTAKDLLIDLKDLKQDLQVQNQLERTAAPNKDEPKTQVLNATTAAAQQTTFKDDYDVKKISTRKLGFSLGIIALILLIIGLGYRTFISGFFASDSNQINSIAVLPFENGSGDPNLDYLSDGLSESLIDKLSQLSQLKVIARNSSFKYRGANIDVQDVANKLGVRAIVMGKIGRVGDNLNVRVEMIDAAENQQLWSEQYNRKATDLVSIQQEIAQTASEKLRLRLSGAQEQKLAKRETTNPQAYELLLKGRYYFGKGGTDNFKKSIDYFEQAIATDPNYALAHAELSLKYYVLTGSSLADPKVYIPKAEGAARKALELDENLAEAHLALSRIFVAKWQWQEGEEERKRAIELDSNNAQAYDLHAQLLSLLGRHDESIAEARRAKELDPLSPLVASNLAFRLHFARRYDESIAELKRILELNPNLDYVYNYLGYDYAGKGQFKEAIAAYLEAIRLGDESTSIQIYLGAAYAQNGEREKAQAILKELQTTKEYVSPGELAILYAASGNNEAAFASLEKAYAEHDLQLQFLKVDPAYDTLRSDPRFTDLMNRVILPQ